MKNEDRSLSKFLSLVLRHKPETIGLQLDEHGWADVAELIAGANRQRVPLTSEKLQQLVATNDKQRFAYSDDGQKIRASQGHSVNVDLQLVPVEPPPILFHGTTFRNLDSIRAQGLVSGLRHHVHLSTDRATAVQVGKRYGPPVLLVVNAQQMFAVGFSFFRAANGVWLTRHVPPHYLEFTSPENDS